MRSAYSSCRSLYNSFRAAKVKGMVRVEETTPSLLSTDLHHEKSSTKYAIYLPPNYSSQKKKYSVLYHLHSLGASESYIKREVSWTAASMEAYSKEEMIIVAPIDPTSSSMFADGKAVKMTTKIMEQVLPHIEKTYSVHTDRSHRYIQGFSMGGFGSALLAFKFPDKFSKCIIWDGALHNWETLSTMRRQIAERQFDNNKQDYFEPSSPWLAVTKYEATSPRGKQQDSTPVLIVSGSMDFTRSSCQRFTTHLKEHGIDDVTHVETDFPHSLSEYLDAYGRKAFEFLNNAP